MQKGLHMVLFLLRYIVLRIFVVGPTVLMEIYILWDMTPCQLVQEEWTTYTLKMDLTNVSEKLVNANLHGVISKKT
jgi:hypothetical protein